MATMDIEIACSECGKDLSASLETKKNGFYLSVGPCEYCKQTAYDENAEEAEA
ncbi:MAG: hypothetical protein WC455_15065 [Dehalococcoidia bacterium]|jgi:hypothetical protein